MDGIEIVDKAVFIPRRKVAWRRVPNWRWARDNILDEGLQELGDVNSRYWFMGRRWGTEIVSLMMVVLTR